MFESRKMKEGIGLFLTTVSEQTAQIAIAMHLLRDNINVCMIWVHAIKKIQAERNCLSSPQTKKSKDTVTSLNVW